jgi:hypothetical protein
MKALVTFAAGVLFALPAAHAQQAKPDPAAAAAVRELLVATHYDQTMKRMLDQMSAQLPQMMRTNLVAGINADSKLSAEAKQKALADLDRRLPGLAATVRQTMSDPGIVNEMLDAMVPLYARHFTADEIKQLAAFYRTPVGQKTMTEMPSLMMEAMQVGQQIMLPRAQKAMAQAMSAQSAK